MKYWATFLALILSLNTPMLSQAEEAMDSKSKLIQIFSNYSVFISTFPNNGAGTGTFFSLSATDSVGEFILITNKHVLRGVDSIFLLVQLVGDSKIADDTITKRYSIYSQAKDSLFVTHDSLDLAAFYLGDNVYNRPSQKGGIYTIKPENIIDYNSVWPGQEILFFGYPNGYQVNEYRPFVRQGIIAGIEKSQFREYRSATVIYIDGQVYGGSSGSPVFIGPNESPGGLACFLGIIAGSIQAQNYLIQDLKNLPSKFVLTENSGLGIVMPAQGIKELGKRAVERRKKVELKIKP